MIDDTDIRLFIRHADGLHIPLGPHASATITHVALARLPHRDPIGNFYGPSCERAANHRLLCLAAPFQDDDARRSLEVNVETTLENGVTFTAKHRIGAHGWGLGVREHIYQYLAELACGGRLLRHVTPDTLDGLIRLVAGTPDQVDLSRKLRRHADELAAGSASSPCFGDYYAHLSLALRVGLLPRAAIQDAEQDTLAAFPDDEDARDSIRAASAGARGLLACLEAGGAA